MRDCPAVPTGDSRRNLLLEGSRDCLSSGRHCKHVFARRIDAILLSSGSVDKRCWKHLEVNMPLGVSIAPRCGKPSRPARPRAAQPVTPSQSLLVHGVGNERPRGHEHSEITDHELGLGSGDSAHRATWVARRGGVRPSLLAWRSVGRSASPGCGLESKSRRVTMAVCDRWLQGKTHTAQYSPKMD